MVMDTALNRMTPTSTDTLKRTARTPDMEPTRDGGDEHGHDGEEVDGPHSGQEAEDDDGDEHGHGGEDGNAHSEFHAHYRCECNGSAIETIGVRLFEYWPRIKAIRVQALTPGGQFGGVAKADDPVIRLR